MVHELFSRTSYYRSNALQMSLLDQAILGDLNGVCSDLAQISVNTESIRPSSKASQLAGYSSEEEKRPA